MTSVLFKMLNILAKGEIELLFKDHNDRDIALRLGSWSLGSLWYYSEAGLLEPGVTVILL